MNFDFIPFKLNGDLSQFKSQIHYVCSDNGVELYKAGKELKRPIIDISISDVNLYFFEGGLITVYIHLAMNHTYIEQVSKLIENLIKRSGKALKMDFGSGYNWETENSTLAIIQDMRKGKLFLYHSLKKFDVF